MNRIYRLVYNRALGVPQVASELAGSRATGTPARGARVRRARLPCLVALSLAGLAGPAVAADYTWASGWYTDAANSSSVAPTTLVAGDLLTLSSGADKQLGCAPLGPNCDGRQDLLIGAGATVAHAAGNLLFGTTGSVLTNQGRYDLQGDVSITGDNSNSGGQFDNQGELLKSAGTGTAQIGGVHFVNSGTVRVLAGTLQFDGDSQGGPAFNDGGVIDTGAGQGIVSFANGATFTGTTTAIDASLMFDGGLFWGNGAVLVGSEAWLRNSANLVGSWTLDGGTLYTNNGNIVGDLEVGNGATLNLIGLTRLQGQGAIHVATGGLIGVSNGELLGGGPVTNDGKIRKFISGTTAFDAALTNRGRVEIDAGTLQLPDTFINDGTVQLRNAGTLQAGDGTAVFQQSATGRVVFGDEMDNLQDNQAGTLAATTLQGGTLVVNASLAPDLRLAQMQALEVNRGDLTLYGDNSAFGGSARVDGGGGFLWVQDGVLGGAVTLTNGGHLGGSGTVTGSVDAQDGALQLGWGSDSQFHIGGALRLGANSRLNAILGAPGSPLASQARLTVGGDLVLDGGLALSATQDMGAGVYRLIDYGGALTDNGLDIYGLPSNLASQVQTSIAQRVSLVVTAAGDDASLSFWNGDTLSSTGTVAGGSGTWSAGARTNWTNANGTASRAWNGQFAVFQGAPGTVTLDRSDGDVSATGLQFVGSGWRLEDAALNLAGSGGAVMIRVGDGSAGGAASSATVASDIRGDATLVKDDLGTLVLTGNGRWQHGTVVRNGTLQIGDGGTAGAITGDVANAGTLAFNRSDAVDFAGAISGAGTLAQAGGGTLRLTGDSSAFSGTTQVRAGTLEVDGALGGALAVQSGATLQVGNGGSAGMIAGDVTNAGTLVFARSDEVSFAGAISGTGTLAQAGGGMLRLSGDSSAFSGATQARAGTLAVDGRLGGSLAVGAGARLQGTGSVGATTVQAGATIAPGNSIGTLSVNGNYVQQAGSTYAVEIDPSGASDRIAVSGSATLQGGTVAVTKAAGTYLPGTSYDILSAAGGVSGRFDAITQDLPFVDLSLRYGANDVLLEVARNAVAFCEVASTANQCGAGGGIESLGDGALYAAVASLPDQASARAAFDALSGELHADAHASLLLQSTELRQVLDRRPTDGRGVWAQALGAWGHLKGDGNAALVKEDHQGMAVGADLVIGEAGSLGALAGYTDGSLRNQARASSMDVRGRHLGVHGGVQAGRFDLRAGLGYSDYRLDSRRTAAISGWGAQGLRADYDAQLWQGFASARFAFTHVLGAQLELAHVQVRTDAFGERGGSAALGVASATSEADTVGAWLVLDVPSADQRLHIDARLGMRHRFGGDAAPAMQARFDGGDSFQILAPRTGDDAVVGRVDLDYALGRNSALSLAYAATAGGGQAAHQASLRYTWRF